MTTVNVLSKKMGISRRTLQYYDRIGLLRPKRNKLGHRMYSKEDEEILGDILILRETGLSLDEIGKAVYGGKDTRKRILLDHFQSLDNQRKELEVKAWRTSELIKTIELEE